MCVRVYVNVSVYVCVCGHVYTCMYTYVHVCMCACVTLRPSEPFFPARSPRTITPNRPWRSPLQGLFLFLSFFPRTSAVEHWLRCLFVFPGGGAGVVGVTVMTDGDSDDRRVTVSEVILVCTL